MDDLKIESNAQEILARFHKLPESVQTAVLAGVKRGLILIDTDIRTKTRVKASGARSGLMSRLTNYAKKSGDLGVDAAIGFRKPRHFPYEYSQEYGAKAKPGKAMAIPVTPEARAMSQRGKGPREFPRKLFMPPGYHILAEATGKATLMIQYILVKSIPPRLDFGKITVAGISKVWKEVVEEENRAFRAL